MKLTGNEGMVSVIFFFPVLTLRIIQGSAAESYEMIHACLQPVILGL